MADFEADVQPGDRVIVRGGREGTVCNPRDYGKLPLKTMSLVLLDGCTRPRWLVNNTFRKKGEYRDADGP